MAMETQDIIKRSATNPITPAPRARDFKAEVAKLIDVSSCVGCKACQVACSEWNDIRDGRALRRGLRQSRRSERQILDGNAL